MSEEVDGMEYDADILLQSLNRQSRGIDAIYRDETPVIREWVLDIAYTGICVAGLLAEGTLLRKISMRGRPECIAQFTTPVNTLWMNKVLISQVLLRHSERNGIIYK